MSSPVFFVVQLVRIDTKFLHSSLKLVKEIDIVGGLCLVVNNRESWLNSLSVSDNGSQGVYRLNSFRIGSGRDGIENKGEFE